MDKSQIDLGKLVEEISPEFAQKNSDIVKISEALKNPVALAAMVYKLAQEREKTNKLLQEVKEQYTQILKELRRNASPTLNARQPLQILPEQDQRILEYIKTNKYATAKDIQKYMDYKGQNAASARLNKLFKDGIIQKIRSGKRVYYTIES